MIAIDKSANDTLTTDVTLQLCSYCSSNNHSRRVAADAKPPRYPASLCQSVATNRCNANDDMMRHAVQYPLTFQEALSKRSLIDGRSLSNNDSRSPRDLEYFHAISNCSIVNYKKFSIAPPLFLYGIQSRFSRRRLYLKNSEPTTFLSLKGADRGFCSRSAFEIFHTYRKKVPYSKTSTR